MDCNEVDDKFLQPLYFTLTKRESSSSSSNQFVHGGEGGDDKVYAIDCLVCPETFENGKEFCQHMVLDHNIVVSDSKLIAHLKSYASYWKKRFVEVPYTEICLPIVLSNRQDSGDSSCQEQLYLLSDAIAEDRFLREKLKRKRLEAVLEQHERERNDVDFKRSCLFCTKVYSTNRVYLFEHMAQDHFFSVGKPDNIVFAHEFLDLMDRKMNVELQCLFCEAVFKDRFTLKEHMRKKLHKKLNPKNVEYDKFYLINYLELDKNWEVLQAEDDAEIVEPAAAAAATDDHEELWGDWHDKELNCVCLFCEHESRSADDILRHMDDVHGFRLKEIRAKHKLTYYKQVKLINYIRRQTFKLTCFSCLRAFGDRGHLLDHLNATSHASFVPDCLVWDQPQFYFPTYENDNLLCALEDNDGGFVAATTQLDFTSGRGYHHHRISGDGVVVTEDDADVVVVDVPLDSVLWNESVRSHLST